VGVWVLHNELAMPVQNEAGPMILVVSTRGCVCRRLKSFGAKIQVSRATLNREDAGRDT